MKTIATCATLFVLLASRIHAQRLVHGVVYDDANGNGVLDNRERPVPGVVVSNQVEVVTTDSAGRYQLPAGEKTIVFVSVPTDWQTVGPSWRTVPSDDSISFGLRAQKQPRSFRFIHASDPHIDSAHVNRVRRFQAMADSIAPALIVISGDLLFDAASQQEVRARRFFEQFVSEMKTMRTPFWTVPGNHDHFGIIPSRSRVPVSDTHPLFNRGMYHLYVGPDYYSFNYGGVHFIGFNTIQLDDSAYYGGIDSLQLAWLRRDLAAVPESTPVVTFSHIPLASGLESMAGYIDLGVVSSIAHPKSGLRFRHMGANTLEVLDAFKGRPLPLILGGHTHVPEKLVFQTDRGPLRFEQPGAIVGPNNYGPIITPSGFSLYTVTKGTVDAGTFVPLTMPGAPPTR